MQQDAGMKRINQLLDFLRENFTPIDNITENAEDRDAICMEARASLLIEANCTGERFPTFMKCGTYTDSGWVYPFHRRYTSTSVTGPSFSRVELHWLFDTFTLRNDRIPVTDSENIIDRWQLGDTKQIFSDAPPWKKPPEVEAKVPFYSNYLDQESKDKNPSLADLEAGFAQVQAQFNYEYRSRFKLCKDISPCKTPEQVCRFFENHDEVFAKLKSGGMRPDCFRDTVTTDDIERTQDQEKWTEEYFIQRYLMEMNPCSLPTKEDSLFCRKYYENWFCQTFPFRNRYGETRMQLIKLYDPDTQSKLLIPVTSWMRGNLPHNQLFCVPIPEDRQPLYNLDLLLDPKTQTIILTDSVELADSNQRHAPAGVVFTSFICSPGRYDQVDWKPLEGKNVYYLITNHSGICLEVATLEAREVKDYLNENEPEVELAFIIVPVDYHIRNRSSMNGRQDFASVDDILTQRRKQSPAVRTDVVRLLESEEDFRNFCQDAENAVNEHPRAWWEKESSSGEQLRLVEQENNAPNAIDYVMRPFLIRGEATMLYARKSVGKSSLAYSIAARVVAANASARPAPLLPEKWWTVPKKGHKVLYLDFENQSQIERKRKQFQDAYFPQDKLAECRANLIVNDLSLSSKDFSAPDNQQEILDMIETAKTRGTPGLAVDLLVIDTYTGFIQTENPATPANFKHLLNRIRSMGIAILIVHHANSENEVRGLQSKLDPFACKFRLYRDNDEPGDLQDQPIWIKYEEWRGEMNAKLREPFQIQYRNDDNHWHVVDPVRDENAELKLIVQDYKRSGYNRDAICAMIGLEKSALSDRLNKANNK